jgi:hypothetical protein
MIEAWFTLIYFFVLIAAAYAADKLNQWLEEQRKSREDIDAENK